MMSGSISSAVAVRIDDFGTGGDTAVRLFFSLSLVVIAGAAVGVVIMLSAFGALNFREKMFPVWTSYLAWLAGAGFVVGIFAGGTDSSAVNMVGFIAFLVFCIWILAMSLLMWRGTAATS